MTFETVMRTPPEGGAAQEMLAISGASARLTPRSAPDGSMIFSVWCQASAAGQIAVSAGDASETVNVTADWTRVFVQFDSTPENVTITVGGEITVYLYKAQLESGNRMTDWKAAPEDTDAEITDAQTSADTAATEAARLSQNLSRYMDLEDSRGFVIRMYDPDTEQPVGDWENIMSEESYQIFNRRLKIVAFEVVRDTVTPRKLGFTANRQTIIEKSDGRGGVVWVKG